MRTRVLPVEAGRLSCPETGQVDLEVCLVCPRFRALLAGAGPDETLVECRPLRTELTAAWSAFADVIGHLPG